MRRDAHMVEKLLIIDQLPVIIRQFLTTQFKAVARVIELRHRIVKMHMHIVQHIPGTAVFMIGQATFVMMRLGLEREEVHMPNRIRCPFGLLCAGHFRAGDGYHLVGYPHVPNERVEVKYGVVFSGNHNLAMLSHKSADTLHRCKGIIETGG